MLTAHIENADLSVLICRSSSIGDVILSSAYLDLFARMPIKVHVTWIGREPTLAVLKTCYPELNILAIGNFDVGKDVAGLLVLDLVIDLQRNLRSLRMTRQIARKCRSTLIRSPKRSWLRSSLIFKARIRGRRFVTSESFQQTSFKQYNLCFYDIQKFIKSRWLATRNSGVQEAMAQFDWQGRPNLPAQAVVIQTKFTEKCELTKTQWLAVAPGAAHPTKRAPALLFTDIILRLKGQKDRSLGLVFLGGKEEMDDCLTVIEKLKWQGPLINLCGQTSLVETMEVLRQCSGILANDSSLGHIAEAVGCSSFVLYGPTVEAFGFAPWRSTSQAFSAALGCRPCSKHGKTPCRYGDQLCFNLIKADFVAAQISHRWEN